MKKISTIETPPNNFIKPKTRLRFKNKVIIIIVVLSLLVLAISFSYAYFTATITGSDATSIITKTASLGLIFTDGNEIVVENAMPGWSENKTFTVENVSTTTVYFEIAWDDIINTFVDQEDLVYRISCTSSIGGNTCDGKTDTPLPEGSTKVSAINGVRIEPGEILTYELTVEFIDQSYNQDVNQGKTFAAKIQIIESKNIADFTGVSENTIYDYLNNYDVPDGVYSVTLANDVVINFEIYNFTEDVTINSTPMLCSGVTDTQMCILKFAKNLTINNRATLTPQVRKKGFTIFVQGTLTNNGNTSMTARGASAIGEDVLLYDNGNGTYETVPAIGADGGAGFSININDGAVDGNTGITGINRQTGGGGSGSGHLVGTGFGITIQPGGTGTSYSGGSGSGSVAFQTATGTGQPGSNTGGAGGYGMVGGQYTSRYNSFAGGGVGNPTGNSSGRYYEEYDKKDGTGGLLIIYANNIINNGIISANGVDASYTEITTSGSGTYSQVLTGGSSGGGSINIFYKNSYLNNGVLSAVGGDSNRGLAINSGGYGATTLKGGNGGDGSITVTKIN